MNLSGNGGELIKFWEKLMLVAYPDPATGGDPWTIGWGHTGPDVMPGQVITEEQAQILFDMDVEEFVAGVNKLNLYRLIPQCQFDALVSFAFNLGPENLGKSSLLRKFLAGDIEGAAREFPKWNNANGKPMRGLTRRRIAEQAMFLGQDWRKVLAEFDSDEKGDNRA